MLDGSQPYNQYGSYGNTICDPGEDVFTQAVLTKDIAVWYSFMFHLPLHYEAFALTDLDADGAPELLLKLSEDFGFELLRAYDGKVYGYPFVVRSMEAITLDGEIHAANGADNFGWYRVSFDKAQIQIAEICWKNDMAAAGEQFTIGGTLVSQEDFTQMNDALWATPAVTFTGLTEEALAAAAAGY